MTRMLRVVHLMDDMGLGGVTRSLADQLPLQRSFAQHEVVRVDTALRLPPHIEADVVVVHFTANWAKLPFLQALRSRMGQRHIILQEHSYTRGFEALHVPVKRRFRTMLRLAYGTADLVAAVSHGQAAWLLEAGLVPRHKLVAIPQALDTTDLEHLPLPDWDGVRPLRLGAYGRYTQQKGFDTLIRAMRGVRPEEATLEFAGYGSEECAMRYLANGMPHVTIGGCIERPADFVANLDAVVIPSHYEAYGLVALEVRAAGRPFVATTVDGLPEQSDPEWAVTCPPRDEAALQTAILQLRNRDLTAMGIAARRSAQGQLAANVHAWTRLLRGLAEALEAKEPQRCLCPTS